MEITDKTASGCFNIFIASILIFFFGIAIVVFFTDPQVKFRNSPELSARVEVVEKRFTKAHNTSRGGRVEARTLYHYYVSFKLSDGSVKEFEVGIDSVGRDSDREAYCFVYNALNEGDVGNLIYNESENAEDRRFSPTAYRRFLSFEKDPEYGGTKVEMQQRQLEAKEIWTAAIAVVLALLFLFYAIRFSRKSEKRS